MLAGVYIQLFITFFKIGLFGFGGGYAMLSIIQYEVVEAHKWLTAGEFTDIVAISQMTPGPVSINTATYIGFTVTDNGMLGSFVATFAVCLPSVIIMALICRFFMAMKNSRYVSSALLWMKPAAIGLIAAAALMLMNRHNFVDSRSVIIAAYVFIFAYFFKTDTIRLIVIAGLTGFLIF
ncbi:MAG: chromate transporter [Tannerella sp.]|jgi:chromate transporter|nr:chromate transporter [Tannerella sp.]